jgi:hypothetical protein
MACLAALAVCALAGLPADAGAACVAPAADKALSQALRAGAPAVRVGTAPRTAAQGNAGNANGSGPIVGQWQVVMTAFPGTPDEFVYDLGFQQFHSDGTELMISAGVPPTIGNVCIGVWERRPGGLIQLRHMTWNWNGDEVLGDAPTGYFLLDITLRPGRQGTTYSGTWKTASYDLGTGPLGSGGPAQPGTEAHGTLEAVRITVD